MLIGDTCLRLSIFALIVFQTNERQVSFECRNEKILTIGNEDSSLKKWWFWGDQTDIRKLTRIIDELEMNPTSGAITGI